VPEVADHLVCSVCGAKNTDTNHPICARPDARVPGVTGHYPDFNKRRLAKCAFPHIVAPYSPLE